MRRLATTALSIAIVVAATVTAALAVDTTARINYIDRDARVIVLAGGDRVVVPERFDIATLNLTMLVTVTYDDTSEEPFQATAITIH